jgi:hypothetical protein
LSLDLMGFFDESQSVPRFGVSNNSYRYAARVRRIRQPGVEIASRGVVTYQLEDDKHTMRRISGVENTCASPRLPFDCKRSLKGDIGVRISTCSISFIEQAA